MVVAQQVWLVVVYTRNTSKRDRCACDHWKSHDGMSFMHHGLPDVLFTEIQVSD